MPTVKGDGMRGLAVFISDIRNCKYSIDISLLLLLSVNVKFIVFSFRFTLVKQDSYSTFAEESLSSYHVTFVPYFDNVLRTRKGNTFMPSKFRLHLFVSIKNCYV